jgi:CBS domain containing-hemolysin-like protein
MSIWPFVAIIVLLVVNGFFVALEFALVGSRRSRLEPLAEQGNRSALRSLSAMQELSIQLAGAQLGITIASLLLGLVGEPAIAHLLAGGVEIIPGVPDGWVHPVAVVFSLLIVVFAHMVIGEMIPKNLTLTHPETTLRIVSGPNRAYLVVARPFVRVLNVVANAGVRLLGVEPRDELASAHTVEELAVVVAASRNEGAIPGFAADLLAGVFEFGNRQVGSVMVPRAQIAAVPFGATVADAEAIAVDQGHSRLPVLGDGGLDDIVGFLHTKDLLTLDPETSSGQIPSRLRRSTLSVLPETTLESLLLSMRRTQTHFAIVVDENLTTVGIVTLDDLLEELVGEITDKPVD